MQGISLPFATPEGLKSIFLAPKQQIETPDSWESTIAENLVHRRMVKMTLRPDPSPIQPPLKKIRKSK